MPPPPRPLWRQVFDEAERRVGRPLEDLTATREFASVLARQLRAQKALLAFYERRTRGLLHALNLPAFSDVARTNRQLTQLQNELTQLNARLDELQAERDREP